MKTGKIYLFMILLALQVGLASCSSNNSGMSSNTSQETKYYTSPAEAVQQAKSDFLEAIRMDKTGNFGVDAASLEKSMPQAAISTREVDFQKLLSADPERITLKELGLPSNSLIVPFALEGRVLTAISLGNDEKGWRIAGLGDQKTSSDLTALQQVIGQGDKSEVTLYEIPNLQATIYAVRSDTTVKYYSAYNGMFRLGEEIRSADLFKVIQSDAREFQRKFGDVIRKEKLVR